jgi:hypothetical protein
MWSCKVKREMLLVVLVALFLTVFVSCSRKTNVNKPVEESNSGSTTSEQVSDQSTSQASSEPAIEITAVQLLEEYNNNKFAADEKYRGKVLVVTGMVTTIGQVLNPYVTIASESGYDIISVQCEFDRSQKGELAKFGKGTKLKIKGVCKGEFVNVMLEDCQIVANLGKVNTQFDKDMKELDNATKELEKLQKDLDNIGK